MPEDSAAARQFAIQVVQTLRDAGFESLWAGGCVRDDLLGISPKDYDVATNAPPDQVIKIFGPKRTVPVGISFGVVMVLGPSRNCGQVEVATFRTDGEYIDGRRPTSVNFCSAEEDARRRDFTINGMFYDPVADQVIDYVGGQTDLSNRLLRAIGQPEDRFCEDKLRMLRAVRFAATYRLNLETRTADAISQLHQDLIQVSVERIAQELRRMLSHSSRSIAWQLLRSLLLIDVIFPHLPISDHLPAALERLSSPSFEAALATILAPLFVHDHTREQQRTAAISVACRRLKLSNDETGSVCWLIDSAFRCRFAASQPLHVIKPILANPRRNLLLAYLHANAVDANDRQDLEFLKSYLAKVPMDVINPPPLVNGTDLLQMQISVGPVFKQLLQTIRNEQLDEKIVSRTAALARIQTLQHDKSDDLD